MKKTVRSVGRPPKFMRGDMAKFNNCAWRVTGVSAKHQQASHLYYNLVNTTTNRRMTVRSDRLSR